MTRPQERCPFLSWCRRADRCPETGLLLRGGENRVGSFGWGCYGPLRSWGQVNSPIFERAHEAYLRAARIVSLQARCVDKAVEHRLAFAAIFNRS